MTPFISALSYSSSYVFTKVSSFNTAVPITQGLNSNKKAYNQRYMRLPDARYAIYGLTGFSFPKNKNSTCSSTIWVNSTLNNVNTYTISTPNSNPTDFWFSADIFTVNVFTLCTPSDGTSPFTFITTIGQKNYFTVPTNRERPIKETELQLDRSTNSQTDEGNLSSKKNGIIVTIFGAVVLQVNCLRTSVKSFA